MKHSTISPTAKTKLFCTAAAFLLLILTIISLITGKYPLSLQKLIAGDEMQLRVFLTLRLSRTVTALIGGFALGAAGFVYQTVFRNPLASPDIIGVSSGASAGAAAGILFFTGTTAVTVSAFAGAIIAVVLSLGLSSIDRTGRNSTIILAGIAVHSLAQTALMCLKLTADPERELASIEYWIMGSLSGISVYSIGGNLILCLVCSAVLFLLHRQIILLSAEEGEARMLGVNVNAMRLIVLLTATLTVSSVVSLTGLISFIGLLAPHGARLLTSDNKAGTMLLGGLLGSILLCGADILARCTASTELPVSIFTSLLGAPFLIYLIAGRRRER
ncbi:MAG: iron ABC transporter permease [Ruminococcaceae bacterium]|nr:iron ABC transporter permease [Oscillospiraceae bacterium]